MSSSNSSMLLKPVFDKFFGRLPYGGGWLLCAYYARIADNLKITDSIDYDVRIG